MHLLLAVSQLRDLIADVRLVIFGEGGERERLQEQIGRLGLKGRVLLAGYRPTARNYLPLLRVFALSSFTEGLPITVLEAMYAGVPIVATRVGAVPEILENGAAGLLVEAGVGWSTGQRSPGAVAEYDAGERFSGQGQNQGCREILQFADGPAVRRFLSAAAGGRKGGLCLKAAAIFAPL